MSIKICLDPGHGEGANVGVAAGYREGTAMWYLAQEYAQALAARGFEVVTTREHITDDPSLESRGKCAVRNGCRVFLSLHSDASGSSAARGVTCIRSLQRPGSAALGRQLAQAVADAMGAPLSPYAGAAGGVWTRPYSATAWGRAHDYYGVLRAAVTGAGVEHAFLLEHSFHTNPADCTTLDASLCRRRIAGAAADALAAYFGMTKADEPAGGAPGTYTYAPKRRYLGVSGGDAAAMLRRAAGLGVAARADVTIGPASMGDDKALAALADSLGLVYEEA